MIQKGIVQSKVEERGKVEPGEVTFSFQESFLQERFLCWVFAHLPLTDEVNLQPGDLRSYFPEPPLPDFRALTRIMVIHFSYLVDPWKISKDITSVRVFCVIQSTCRYDKL